MKKKRILYQDVFDKVKKSILDGTYPINSQIPTENELVEKFGVSKITVRNAIQILSDEGYLEKLSGRGTMVINNRPFNVLSNAKSYSKILEEKGFEVLKEILSVKKVDNPFDFSFVYPSVYKMVRTYKIDGENSFYYVHYFSLPDGSEFADKVPDDFSLYSFFGKYDLSIYYIEDSFEAALADDKISNLLQPKNNIVLKRVRRSLDEDLQVIEYSESFYDSSKYPYMINYEV